MADSAVVVTAGTGTNIDTRTEGTNGHHRQVVVLGDPATNAGVAPVDATAGLKVDLGADNDVVVSATDLDIRDLAKASDSVTAAIENIHEADFDSGAGTDTTPAIGIAVPASGGAAVITGDTTNGLDVDVTRSALPSGAATSAKQDTAQTSLDAIKTAVEVLDNVVSGSEAQVDVVGALPAGDNNIGNVDLASAIPAGTNNIGDVDVLTVPADPFGANADAAATAGSTGSIQAKLRLLTSQLDAVKTAVETLDNAISGSEMQVDVVGALPAGTNNIGDVDILSIAAGDNNIGNVDVVTLPATPAGTNAIGKLLPPDIDVTTHTNYAKKYYTNAGAVTDGIIWSPAAGKRWHVVALHIQVSAAATVTLEDDKAGGDEVIFKAEYAANGGEFLVFPEKYPLASGEDAADLLITTSAGNVYVTAVGYEI